MAQWQFLLVWNQFKTMEGPAHLQDYSVLTDHQRISFSFEERA